jgi:GT2 family glycosyltransferase
MSKKISVIVPNYNGKHFLRACFTSLFSTGYSPLEVVMVDNASTDGSVDFVRSHFPKVKIIQSVQNLGFAGAVNLGIKAAKGDYLAILNNDTVVDSRWLIELKKAIASHPEVGFCASKMVWLKNAKILDSAGIIYSWKGKAYDRGHGETDEGQYDQPEYVFGACNGASFYQRSVFEKIGLFDENFFLVADDVDFSFRAQLAGIKCLYVPTAMVKHAGGGTVITWTEKKARFSAKHHLYIIIKNFPTKFLLLNLPQVVVERLRNLSGILKSVPWWRRPFVVLLTYSEVILRLPAMLKERKLIQKRRKVSDEYLCSIIRRADFSAD